MDKILSFSSHGIPKNDTERKIYLNEHYDYAITTGKKKV
jgi:hypothetical protein